MDRYIRKVIMAFVAAIMLASLLPGLAAYAYTILPQTYWVQPVITGTAGTADGIYDFGSLGDADSGGAGFKKQGDKFVVSNVFWQDTAREYLEYDDITDISYEYLTDADPLTGSVVIKAEGGSVNKKFTLKDMYFNCASSGETWSGFHQFNLTLKLADGTTVNHSLAASDMEGGTADTSNPPIYTFGLMVPAHSYEGYCEPLSHILHSTWPAYGYDNVVEIDITFQMQLPNIPRAWLNFRAIKVANVSASLVSDITSAGVTGMTAPAVGSAPIPYTNLAPGNASYTVTSLTWQNGDGSAAALTGSGMFKAGATYKAVVELTSAAGYKFPSGGIASPSVNAGTAGAGTVSGGDVEGNKLTYTVTFPATAPLSVSSIGVKAQPATLTYIEGDTLSLSGLAATLTYNDGTTADVAYTNFGANSITASPDAGTALTVAAHNGHPVTLTCNTHTASTSSLTVNAQLGAASVTMTAPAAGAVPQDTAAVELATANFNYTVSNIVWNEALTPGGRFKAGQTYTATITLASKNGTRFQQAAFTPAVAGAASVSGTTTFGTGAGNTVTFTVTYAPTAPLAVTGIAVAAQPAKMSYTEVVDGTLALNGMVITEIYNDGTNGTVTFTDGTASGYTASPANGTALTNAVHNGAKVTVTHTASGQWDQTGSLTVAPAPTYGISLLPGTDYTFPAEYVGYTPQTGHTVIVNSTGTGATGPLTVALGGVNSDAFELSVTSISSIAASGSGSFAVAPKPGLAAGTYTATVTVSGGSVASQSFNVSFTVNDTYGISLAPGTDHTFPAEYVGYTPQTGHTVTVNNTGTGATGPLTVSLGGTNPAAFELSATSISSIAALGSGSFAVAPKPDLAAGIYTATVTVSGGSVASQGFNISFTVNDTYGISLDPGTYYFFPAATVGYGAQTAHTVTVNNTGTGATGPLTVSLEGINPAAFDLSTTSISSIAALGSGSFSVVPKTDLVAGAYSATVTVSGGELFAQSFNVSFIVNDTFGIFLNPGTEDTFPAAEMGYGAQTAHTVTVFNSGTGATGLLTVALSGVNPAAFELSATSISSIAASGSGSFTIAPKTGLASGTYTATVTVSGIFVVPRSIDVSFTVNDIFGIFLNPGTEDTFPAAAVGYGAQPAHTVTVFNSGTGATGPLTAALGGTNPDAFDLSATSISSIAVSGSGSFTIAPKTGLASGTYTATVTVSGVSMATRSIDVSFTVDDTYIISLNPGTDYIFPAADVGYGAQAACTVTVNNAGSGAAGPLTVSLGGTNPAAFDLSSTFISSLAPLGSDSFAIMPRTGLAAGNYTATVTVSGGFSIVTQSLNVSFKVNYVMSEGVLEKQVESATIIAEGMFAEEARLIVTPIAEGDTDRSQLEEQLTAQNAIAAYEVHVEPADAFRPPLTLTFQVGQSFNGRIVYILHKLSNGSTDIYTPTVTNGEAVITVNELSPFLLAVDPAVVITQQPQSALALAGQTADFHVEANGLDLTYRWQRRTGDSAAWEDISGATGADYTTTTVNMSHNGYQYRVIVTDVLGNSASSDTAVLTVTVSPATGDDSQPLVYAIMTVLFAAVVIILLRKRRMA